MRPLVLLLIGITLFSLAGTLSAQFGRGGPEEMIRSFPVLRALDTDEDGKISAEEIAGASEALRSIDKNGDGILTPEEMLPEFGRGGPGGRGGRGGRGGGFGGGEGETRRLSPDELEFDVGTASIPDRETFEKLSYQGSEVMIDTHLTGLEFVKFQLERANTEKPEMYFINTEKIRAHPMFMQRIGLPRGDEGQMRGVLVYRPLLTAPNGEPGHYTFEFEPNDSYPFEMIQLAYRQLVEFAPILENRLSYHALPRARTRTLTEKDKYDAAKLPIFLAEDVYSDIGFLPLNRKASFGLLRVMEPAERPGPRDIVIYRALPNEMPRVAGIITVVRQTPLSHVNLRAIQDGIPNAYIANAITNERIAPLIGKYVYYSVSGDGFKIREASVTEVEHHFAAMRPKEVRTPPRDLAVTGIRPLAQISFEDSKSFGVKAANLAAMRSFGLPDGVVPDGFAVPFHFYDAFMKHNGLYERATAMLEEPEFQSDTGVREKALVGFRREVENGEVPEWMAKELRELQSSFPKRTNLRCRSSTNNEDLPGFSGAGLYDSFTHRPSEGDLSSTIHLVYASLWNFRAFEEREFYRVDHLATAMGVLVHPSFSNEQANGVAVTEDIVYQTADQVGRTYYINAQIGEDLVTNPSADAIPEELLIHPNGARRDQVMQRSNLIPENETVLNTEIVNRLREHLAVIHRKFSVLYGKSSDQPFSIEIEFKITELGDLSIKQARPWVHETEAEMRGSSSTSF